MLSGTSGLYMLGGKDDPKLPEDLVILCDGIHSYGYQPSQYPLVTSYSSMPLDFGEGAIRPVFKNLEQRLTSCDWNNSAVTNLLRNGPVTMEWWMYIIGSTSINDITVVFGSLGTSYWDLTIGVTSGHPVCWLNDSTVYTASGINMNTWKHCAITVGGGKVAYFCDGHELYRCNRTYGSYNSNLLRIQNNIGRSDIMMAQLAVYNTVRYSGDYTVPTEPIWKI